MAALLVLIVFALIGVLHLFALDPANSPAYRPIVAMALAGLLLVLSRYEWGDFPRRRLLIMYLWFGFSTMSLTSAVLNDNELVPEVWQLLGVPLVIFTAFPQLAKERAVKVVLLGVFLGFLPYLIVSVAKYPLLYPYRGVLDNPNALGMISVTMAAAVLAWLRGVMAEQRALWSSVLYKMFLIGVLVILGGLILASNSRTSFLTGMILYGVFFLSLFAEAKRYRTWIVLSAVLVAGVAVSLPLAVEYVDAQSGGLLGSLLSKFANKAADDDVLSGRNEVWQMILRHIEVFGIGTTAMDEFGVNPHNTYMWMLGSKGPIALVFFASAQWAALVAAIKYAWRNIKSDGYALGPILILLNYMVMGMAEAIVSTLGDGIQMSFMLMIGALLYQKKSDTVAMDEQT